MTQAPDVKDSPKTQARALSLGSLEVFPRSRAAGGGRAFGEERSPLKMVSEPLRLSEKRPALGPAVLL